MIIFEQSDYLLTCKNFKHLTRKEANKNQLAKYAASKNKILLDSLVPMSSATNVGINTSSQLSPEWSIKLAMTSSRPSKANLLSISVLLSIRSSSNMGKNLKSGCSKNIHLLRLILRNAPLKTVTTYSRYRSANGGQMLMKNVPNAMLYSYNQLHSISKVS